LAVLASIQQLDLVGVQRNGVGVREELAVEARHASSQDGRIAAVFMLRHRSLHGQRHKAGRVRSSGRQQRR
jgi:hypothetical protein